MWNRVNLNNFKQSSLLSEWSARKSFKTLQNFRKAKIYGFQRSFNLVSLSQIKNGYSNIEKGEVASISAVKSSSDKPLFVTIFEIEDSDWEIFIERYFFILKKRTCI
jgi:hypothetical protein